MGAVRSTPQHSERGGRRPARGSLRTFVSGLLFTETVYFTIVVPLVPHFRDLGASTSELGLLVGAYPAGLVLGSLAAIRLTRVVGIRQITALGLALLAVASAPFGVVEEITPLIALRLIQGVGGAWAWTGALAWLVSSTPSTVRGRTIGTAFGWSIAGAVAGPLVGAAALGIGLGISFVILALGEASLALITRITKRPVPPVKEGAAGSPQRSLSRRFLTASLVLALPAIWLGAFEVLIPLQLIDSGGGSATIAVVFGVAAAGEALISPLSGSLADRLGPQRLVRAGLLCMPLALIPLGVADSVLAVGIFTVATWLGVAFVWVPAILSLSHAAEQSGIRIAAMWSLTNVVLAAGAAIGSSVGARLAEATTDLVPFTILGAAGVVTAALIRLPDHRPPAEQ